MSIRGFSLLVLFVLLVAIAHGQTGRSKPSPSKSSSVDVSYLKGMPSPATVVEGIVGSNAADTYARRSAALSHVQKVIRFHGMYRMLTTEEERAIARYDAKIQEESVSLGIKQNKRLASEASSLYMKYIQDSTYLNSVLTRTVSPSTLQYYYRVQHEFDQTMKRKADEVQRAQNSANRSARTQFLLTAIPSIGIPAFIWIGVSILLGKWNQRKGNSFWAAFLLSALLSPLLGLVFVVMSREKPVVQKTPVGDHEIIAIPIVNPPDIGPSKRYKLNSTTGIVVSVNKGFETRVHGSDSISSTTVVHDQIILQDQTGKEHALKLQNFDIACRVGHMLTALWAADKKTNWWNYVALHNHTTSETVYAQSALLKVFVKPRSKRALKGAVVVGIIGALIGLMIAVGRPNAIPLIFWFPVSAGSMLGMLIGAFFGSIIQASDKRAMWRFRAVLAQSLSRASENG